MSTPTRPRRAAASALALAAVVLPALAGCTAAVPLTAADGANSPDCAQVTVHLPESVNGGDELRRTDAQATGAWGTPASVLLRCGVETPAVSDLPCYTIQGVDWLVDESEDDPDTGVLRSYGRTPGVEVVVDLTRASSGTVARELTSAVGYLPQDGKQCTDATDVPLEGTDGAPTPSS